MSAAGTVPRLSAGVLTADLTRLGDELDVLRGTGCWAHVDVMDGSFCPLLTVGPGFVAGVAATGIPVDAHLLVDEPRRLLPDIVAARGAAILAGRAAGVLPEDLPPGWPPDDAGHAVLGLERATRPSLARQRAYDQLYARWLHWS